MNKQTIGTNAGIIWQLLSNNKRWEYNELLKASQLDKDNFNAAIGWLAREDKIMFEETADHLYLGLQINFYY